MDILFVCHANVCRSALAERITRHTIAGSPALRELGLSVRSAGTHAEPSLPMHPAAREVLVDAGINAEAFRSRPVSADLLNRASLVLAATRQQRSVCAAVAPEALRRVFTLRQFGRLSAYVAPERLGAQPVPDRIGALVEEVLLARGDALPVPPAEDDLADPAASTLDEVRSCAHQIDAAMRPVLALLVDAAHRHVPR